MGAVLPVKGVGLITVAVTVVVELLEVSAIGVRLERYLESMGIVLAVGGDGSAADAAELLHDSVEDSSSSAGLPDL